jgi:hypothetical protein
MGEDVEGANWDPKGKQRGVGNMAGEPESSEKRGAVVETGHGDCLFLNRSANVYRLERIRGKKGL